MPARLMVQTGIAAGTSHIIERPVIRIGSDPSADLCLPSARLAAHAITLEFRDGAYRLYNRSGSPLRLGHQVIAANEAAVWLNAAVLQLDDENEIELQTDFDPAPSPAQLTNEQVWPAESPPEPSSALASGHDNRSTAAANGTPINGKPASSGSSTMLQLAVIGICLAGCALLIARDQLKGAATKKAPSFTSLVTRGLESETASKVLIQRLQFAEAARVRGRKKDASERYLRLRDDLVSQSFDFDDASRHVERDVLDFVESRIEELE